MLTGTRAAIGIVSPCESGGGAEYQIRLLIDALIASRAYDIHYLAHFVDGDSQARGYRAARLGRGGSALPIGYLSDARSLYEALDAVGPKVIYQRVACGYTGLCAAYSRRRQVPMVWHVAHDTDGTPEPLDRSRNVLKTWLEKRAVRYGARRATSIVVQTRQQADLLRRHYGRWPQAVIPNFHPPAPEEIDKSGPLTVVWISNLKPWKRPEAFIRLAAAWSSRGGVRFVMVGSSGAGPSNWRDSLLRSIEATPNLEYLGARRLEEVNALLARAHIFVNTSTHEGFPNTFIQSWQREAVVVSLGVDPDRVLERERVGIAASSEAQLFAAVEDLVESAGLRAEYAARARAYVDAHHSLSNARTLVELIEACHA
jgi:glycosyltransferase involved in cell wall biosynthesis